MTQDYARTTYAVSGGYEIGMAEAGEGRRSYSSTAAGQARRARRTSGRTRRPSSRRAIACCCPT
ncbi:hypothetical protein ACFSTI_11455 [Rhizorhabdus histidinilytica]